MLISEAIELVTDLTGQVVDNAELVRWLSEVDGTLAFEFYRTDAWAPYDPEDDTGCELLVPFPWDGFYPHHLEAMTYYTNGEYDRYANAAAMAETQLTEFRHFMQRTQSALCGCGFPTEKNGGTGITIIDQAECHSPWFWLSAYSLAVKHGFHGTEDEWIDEQRAYVDAALAAASAAQNYAEAAGGYANAAVSAAADADSAAYRAENASEHPPVIDPDGTWRLWIGGQYQSTTFPSQGPPGTPGAPGPTGPRGPQGPRGFDAVAVETQGMFYFSVDADGHLILTYTGDDPPDFEIDEDTGHLIWNTD